MHVQQLTQVQKSTYPHSYIYYVQEGQPEAWTCSKYLEESENMVATAYKGTVTAQISTTTRLGD